MACTSAKRGLKWLNGEPKSCNATPHLHQTYRSVMVYLAMQICFKFGEKSKLASWKLQTPHTNRPTINGHSKLGPFNTGSAWASLFSQPLL
eukprot:4212686-Amphidinium_carterae.1